MYFKKLALFFAIIIFSLFSFSGLAKAQEQPIAIFHAFNQQYKDIENFVCTLADQGYSHIQISPAQKSNPGPLAPPMGWAERYQPIDYSMIEGLGLEKDLEDLIIKAHDCNMEVIADVVFNHMANLDNDEGFEDLNRFPGLSQNDFRTLESNPGQRPCEAGDNNGYSDGNRNSELNCWLGGLPDLIFTDNVKTIQKAHLKKLIALGIDGFRFDAAKHMSRDVVKEYIDFINSESDGKTWNYLEVIEDNDTKAEDYNFIAAVTDFRLYNSMKDAFTFGGDLRSLPANAVNDPRSVTFGRNHDTIREIRTNGEGAINPYDDITDSYLATGYVLAREDGTPLIFNADNLNSPYIKYGVKFRQIMTQRGQEGKNVKENILRVINSPTILLMERGAEGFLVENKGIGKFDIPVLDLTLSNLEGCYQELRNDFTVAIERRDAQKFVTRWGTNDRGGLSIEGRDALYFIRTPFSQCID